MIFTDREKRAVILISVALAIGVGLLVVKAHKPALFLGKPDFYASDKSSPSPEAKTSIPQPAKPDVVNINTASRAELQSLEGIGPVIAGRIIEYRERNGGFKRIEEIMNVSGIGEKTFQRIRSRITVRDEEKGGFAPTAKPP